MMGPLIVPEKLLLWKGAYGWSEAGREYFAYIF